MANETVNRAAGAATLATEGFHSLDDANPTTMEEPSLPGGLARLGAVLAAAERLAEELEDGASACTFDLVTAMQCVLAQARRDLLTVAADNPGCR